MLTQRASISAAVLVAGLAGVLVGADTAEASACRSLEMQLMQAQSRGQDTAGVRGMMHARGCAGGRPAASAAPRQRREGFSGLRILGRVPAARQQGESRREARRPQERKSERKSKRRQSARSAPAESVARGSGRTFRTLCVRTCDGYYFPVSYSTTREHFAEDQATCQQMCPGTETALYHHAVRGETAEAMISVEGAAYVDLPTAFQYRTSLDSACTCGRADSAMILASFDGTAEQQPTETVAALPRPRPEPGEDPETLANRAGALDLEATDFNLYASRDGRYGRSVRVIEPAYSAVPAVPVIVSAIPVEADPAPTP